MEGRELKKTLDIPDKRAIIDPQKKITVDRVILIEAIKACDGMKRKFQEILASAQ
jgi:hypothetical protein